MKKIILYSVLTWLAIAAAGAQAQTTDTAFVLLRGTVPQRVEITVTPSPDAESLPLDMSGPKTVTVADVVFRSNTAFGVAVVSTNSLRLQQLDGSFIPYTLSDEAGVTLDSLLDIASGTRTQGNTTLAIVMNFTVPDILPNPGEYSDTLTFTITAQ